MALPATDNFNRSDSTDLGTNWDVIYGTGHQVLDNACSCNTGAGDGYDGAEIWNADSFNNDQYSQATVAGTMGTGGATGLLVRGSETDNYYGYYAHSTTGWLFKVVGGSWTTEGTGNSWSVSDEVYLEANGTTITAKKNGSNDSSVSSPWTDSDLSSGSAGVSGYGTGSGMGYLDDWEGGNLGAATPEPNVSSGITVGESVSLDVSDPQVNVSSGVTVGESVTGDVADPQIDVSDSIAVGDSVSAYLSNYTLSVSDSTTVGESIVINASDPQIDVSDSLSVGDATPAVQVEGGVEALEINITLDNYDYWVAELELH